MKDKSGGNSLLYYRILKITQFSIASQIIHFMNAKLKKIFPNDSYFIV